MIVVLIVAIVMIASIFAAALRHHRPDAAAIAVDPRTQAENQRLREEVKELKERLKVLERITVEKENSLAKEIE